MYTKADKPAAPLVHDYQLELFCLYFAERLLRVCRVADAQIICRTFAELSCALLCSGVQIATDAHV